jgi:hypothetical protein
MAGESTAIWQAPRFDKPRRRSAGAEDVARYLAIARPSGLHGVSCRMVEGKVVLSGKVRSFYLKQLAQEILRKVDGIGSIDNQLEVT